MNYSRTLKPICGLLAAALLAFGQTPPPAAPAAPAAPMAPLPPTPPAAVAAPLPPTPPTPPEEPMPAMAPLPPLPPIPPIDIDLGDLDIQIKDLNLNLNLELQDQIESAKEMAREQVGRMKFEIQDRAREMAQVAKSAPFAYIPQIAISGTPQPSPMPYTKAATVYRNMSDDRLYSSGQSALDNRRWDDALGYFNQVISRAGQRVDGALYWKAYALGKLGRRDEAVAAVAELRKSYASSRWMDDAKALELELKQASGQNVSPDAVDDEELKLMAINGLMQSDPERAIPLLEGQLKGSASPKVKRNTLFVLAQSNSPKAQALIEQIARGGANPDLQLKAISFMDQRRKPNNAQVLAEIYASTSDVAVKRAILQSYAGMRDKDRLFQAAKGEKSPELRQFAIGVLAGNNGTPELWQLYQMETTTDGKLMVLRYMYNNSNSEKLLEVVRNEKDPKVRGEAMRVLASQKTGVTGETMVQLYNAEQDPQIKWSIIDGLTSRNNAKALIDIVRSEKDTKMKLRIVERLSNMKSREAIDYLEELLKK